MVDLTPALKDAKRKIGQVGVVITPTSKGEYLVSIKWLTETLLASGHHPNKWNDRGIIKAWIQCTHIGTPSFLPMSFHLEVQTGHRAFRGVLRLGCVPELAVSPRMGHTLGQGWWREERRGLVASAKSHYGRPAAASSRQEADRKEEGAHGQRTWETLERDHYQELRVDAPSLR